MRKENIENIYDHVPSNLANWHIQPYCWCCLKADRAELEFPPVRKVEKRRVIEGRHPVSPHHQAKKLEKTREGDDLIEYRDQGRDQLNRLRLKLAKDLLMMSRRLSEQVEDDGFAQCGRA